MSAEESSALSVTSEHVDAVAERIFAAVGDLGARFGRERSLKIDTRGVFTNRFLLGIRKSRISGDPDARLLDLCDLLGMPASAMSRYRSELPDAQYVHFGFEDSGGAPVVKAYLEFFEHVDARMRTEQHRQSRYLIHRGFKWQPNVDAADITSYWWHPYLTDATIASNLKRVLSDDLQGDMYAIVDGLLREALQRVRPQDLHFLEVEESGNERRSFDLNFYRARLRMGDIRSFVEASFALHGQSFCAFVDRFTGIAGESFGHLAAGVDRDGRSFETFYYGMAYFEPTLVGDRAS